MKQKLFIIYSLCVFLCLSDANASSEITTYSATCTYCDNYQFDTCTQRDVEILLDQQQESLIVQSYDKTTGKLVSIDVPHTSKSKCSFINLNNWSCKKKAHHKVAGSINYTMSKGKYSQSFAVFGNGRTIQSTLTCP